MEAITQELPVTPGIYIFWEGGKPIYIGKAINLKRRVSSYFGNDLGKKTELMVKSAQDLTYIRVNSEIESLLLEAELINKHKPKFNIVLKDDKHPLYIAITNEVFPRVLSVRKIETKKFKNVFGPFPSSSNVKYVLKMIRRVFPYSDHKLGKRGCIYSHIGLCDPCPNIGINSKEKIDKYNSNIKNIKKLLSGKFTYIKDSLEKEMKMLSNLKKYEEAAIILDKIKRLDYITQPTTKTEDYIKNPNLLEDTRKNEIEELSYLISKYLTLPKNDITRIECFDIAHLQGVSATASMVVAIEGEMDHSEYRHFKVKQGKGQSDYDSMREIAKRRFNKLNDKNKKIDKSWTKPDLIIVDGGLGQVKIFDFIFSKVGIAVVGIAKHPDRLIFPTGDKVILKGPVLHLVSRMRDEAHRFARRYHHGLLLKKLKSNA